jgi:hypothetical protein
VFLLSERSLQSASHEHPFSLVTEGQKPWRRPPNHLETGMTKAIPENGATLVITHAELSSRHGTGALLLRLLQAEPSLMVFYSHRFFETHDIDVPAFHIRSKNLFQSKDRRIRNLLAHKSIGRILCVPFYPDDVQTALTAQACTGAPLALYIMDDQNIHTQEIPDHLLSRLIQCASVCVAISPALCEAYSEKYGRRFWFAPPTADPDLFVPPEHHFEQKTPPRGILVGNLWSSQTLGRFRDTVRLSGLQIDWCGNAGKPFIALDADELKKDGIILRSHLPEPSLIELARSADFAVVPAGALDGSDTHDWLARASLPSRIVYLMATANIPIIVMGHPETAAARFVMETGLGAVCDYSADSFRATVKEVTAASQQIRERANRLSPTFSTRALSTWLWESMQQGQAIDDRFETLNRSHSDYKRSGSPSTP